MVAHDSGLSLCRGAWRIGARVKTNSRFRDKHLSARPLRFLPTLLLQDHPLTRKALLSCKFWLWTLAVSVDLPDFWRCSARMPLNAPNQVEWVNEKNDSASPLGPTVLDRGLITAIRLYDRLQRWPLTLDYKITLSRTCWEPFIRPRRLSLTLVSTPLSLTLNYET
ncbi:hypothetical protein BKA81DRAFT_112763 [Phyllosticta paracitricarpa]